MRTLTSIIAIGLSSLFPFTVKAEETDIPDTLKVCQANLPEIGDGIYFDLPDNQTVGLDSSDANYLYTTMSRGSSYGLIGKNNKLYGVFLKKSVSDSNSVRNLANAIDRELSGSVLVARYVTMKETDFDEFLSGYPK